MFEVQILLHGINKPSAAVGQFSAKPGQLIVFFVFRNEIARDFQLERLLASAPRKPETMDDDRDGEQSATDQYQILNVDVLDIHASTSNCGLSGCAEYFAISHSFYAPAIAAASSMSTDTKRETPGSLIVTPMS